MRRARLCVFLLAGAACHENTRFDPPPLEGAATLLVVHERGAELLEGHVLAAGDPIPELPLRPGDLLHAATYSRSLTDYGIAVPSELELGEADTPVVPGPERAYELGVGISNAWAAPAEIPSLWSRVRARRAVDSCEDFGRFEMAQRKIDGSEDMGPCHAVKRRFGPPTVVGNKRGLWAVAPDETTQLLVTGTSTRGFTGTATAPLLTGAFDIGFGGEYFWYQRGGQLWVGDFFDGFERVGAPAPDAGSAKNAWITMSDGQSIYELYVLDSQGGVYRNNARGWATLLMPQPNDPELDWQGAIAWLNDERVFVVGPRGGKAFDIRGDVVTEVTGPWRRLTFAINTLGGGLYAGDDEGGLWRNEADMWTKLDAPPANEGAIITIQSFRGGVLYGGGGGVLTFYSDQRPGCHPTITTPATTFSVTAVSASRYMLLSSSGWIGDAGPITLTVLDTD